MLARRLLRIGVNMADKGLQVASCATNCQNHYLLTPGSMFVSDVSSLLRIDLPDVACAKNINFGFDLVAHLLLPILDFSQ